MGLFGRSSEHPGGDRSPEERARDRAERERRRASRDGRPVDPALMDAVSRAADAPGDGEPPAGAVPAAPGLEPAAPSGRNGDEGTARGPDASLPAPSGAEPEAPAPDGGQGASGLDAVPEPAAPEPALEERRPAGPIRIGNGRGADPIVERGGPRAPVPPSSAEPPEPGAGSGEHEVAAGTGEHELAPETGEHELAPETGEHELAPETGEHELAAGTGEHELAPATGEHELAAGTGEREVVRWTGEHHFAHEGEHDAAAAGAPIRAAPADVESPRRPRRRRGATAAVGPYAPGAVGAGARGEGGARRRPGRIVARLFAAILLVVVLALLYLVNAIYQPFHGAARGQVAVVVPQGATARKVGNELARDGVVSSGLFFYLHARLAGKGSSIKPGRYLLQRDMSYASALDALARGPIVVRTVTVTIIPGSDRLIASRLVAADGLQGNYLTATVRSSLLNPRRYGARHAPNLEGFLFPDTFTFPAGTSVQRLVSAQLLDFRRRFSRVNLAAARRAHLTPYDVVTIASMVEKEAGTAADRPKVAAVIYNRLRLGIPLGIDATILYGLGGDFTRPLTESDLTRDTPYNTRVRKGLPPTPISEPGLSAIQAAAHPARVPYLYFVVKPGTCGQSVFETSYAQFLRDSKRYTAAKAANGGRSPTRC